MRTKRMRFQRKESRYWQSYTREFAKAQASGVMDFDGRVDFEGGLDHCERCGGEGMVELHDAPDQWGEDCCCEENRTITCPDCKGDGVLT